MKRKIKYIDLHDNLFLPGTGNLGKSFPSPLKDFTVEMTYTDGSPVVEFVIKGRFLLVPVALVKNMEVGEQVPSESKKSN